MLVKFNKIIVAYFYNYENNFMWQIYQFPDCDTDEDEDFKQQDRELKACIPFAVVGSNTVLEVAGKRVRGRQYPWGVVEGKFSSKLKEMVFWYIFYIRLPIHCAFLYY